MKLVSWWLWIALGLAAQQWNPAEFADQTTIEFLTVGPEEGEHWSTVWFVVIDRAVYVRLGPRAARRIESNSTAPGLRLRVAGKETYPMRYAKAPEMAEKVATAMGEKYWSDVFGEPFRRLGLSSPALIVRLLPES